MTTRPAADLERGIREAVAHLRTWKRGERRAPHKPLLLLYALGRIQAGAPRLVDFVEAEPCLKALLDRFGPPSKAAHPLYPFWHLQGDGLWEVPRGKDATRRDVQEPLVSLARELHLEGGFPEPVERLLKRRPVLVSELGRTILEEHFPESLHDEIAEAAGLELAAQGAAKRQARPPGFRDEILRAYEHRCAICGFQALLDGAVIGVEAAHVRWHAYGGPAVVENGVALCVLHHKLFDLGVLGISPGRRVLVSTRASGEAEASARMIPFAGRLLRSPQSGKQAVGEDFAGWHRREVFRSPARVA
jgi:putative restriction endonuclease